MSVLYKKYFCTPAVLPSEYAVYICRSYQLAQLPGRSVKDFICSFYRLVRQYCQATPINCMLLRLIGNNTYDFTQRLLVYTTRSIDRHGFVLCKNDVASIAE
jgi:hypothetical protein